MTYSIAPRESRYVNVYVFLSIAIKFGDKYSKKILMLLQKLEQML